MREKRSDWLTKLWRSTVSDVIRDLLAAACEGTAVRPGRPAAGSQININRKWRLAASGPAGCRTLPVCSAVQLLRSEEQQTCLAAVRFWF